MKSLLKLSLTTLLSLPLISHAALFNFSYEFQNGYGDNRGLEPTKITGSFNGNQDGLFVRNLSNISVNIQGRDFSQPLSIFLYDPTTANGGPFTSDEGLISFDAMLNNFMIADSDYLTNGSFTNYFIFINYQNSYLDRSALNDNGGQSYGFDQDSFSNNSWRLTQVPEPASWLLMAGGLALFACRRRAQ